MENKLNYFNFLYATDNGFVGFESKLNKKEKKTLKAKLIWKRETKDSFAIGFARFYYVEKIGETKETYQSAEKILEIYKKEKGL